jgi:hypothetical protein
VKNILLYKLVLLNALAAAWLGVTNYQSGWFTKLFHADTTNLNYATASLFILVWLGTWLKAKEMNTASNNITGERVYLNDWTGELRIKQMEWIERAAGWMLFLGLIGTLYGLMISLSGINTGNINSVDGLKIIGVQLITGLRIEISTTLIGAMLALWTEVNYAVIKYTADFVAAMEEEALARDIMEDSL